MKKILPRLKDFYKDNEEFNCILTCTNVDDIFKVLVTNDVKEIEVDREEMFIITQFCIVNATSHEVYQEIDWEKLNWLVWRALAEGKVSKFFGIKLKLL